MGVSRERIRQLEAKALKTLRLKMTRRADFYHWIEDPEYLEASGIGMKMARGGR